MTQVYVNNQTSQTDRQPPNYPEQNRSNRHHGCTIGCGLLLIILIFVAIGIFSSSSSTNHPSAQTTSITITTSTPAPTLAPIKVYSLPFDSNSRPRFSPDSSHLVYEKDKNLFVSDIYGKNAIKIATTQCCKNYNWLAATQATWSPDGKQIAFIGADVWSTVWVVNPDGSGLKKVFNYLHQNLPWTLVWLPTGKIAAIGRYIWFIDPDGSSMVHTNDDFLTNKQPNPVASISPDGQTLLFDGHDRDQGDTSDDNIIAVASVDTPNKRQILVSSSLVANTKYSNYHWLNDGKTILYFKYVWAGGYSSLHTVNIENRRDNQILDLGYLSDNSFEFFDSSMSPNNNWIILGNEKADNIQLYDRKSGTYRFLLNRNTGEGFEKQTYITWSPDSHWAIIIYGDTSSLIDFSHLS